MKTYQTPSRPDPRIRTEIIDSVALRYQEMLTSKRGGVIFVAADEPGMGRHATLQALFAHFQKNYREKDQQCFVLGGTIEAEQFQPWQQLPENSTALGLAHQLLGISGDAAKKDLLGNVLALADATGKIALPMLGFVAQLLQTISSAQALTHELIAKNQLGEVRPDPNDLRKLLRRAAIDRPVVCIFDRFDHFDPIWWSAFFMGFAGELQYAPILFVVSLTGDKLPPALDAENRENYKTLPLIASMLQRQGCAEWSTLSHYTQEEVKKWIGLADDSLPDRLYRATSGHPRHMRELWADWQRHGLLYASLDDLIWRLKWQPSNAQLGEVGELLDERFARLFPELDEVQRQDLQRELAFAALEGEATTAQSAAQILGEDVDDWIDLLDERLIFSDENPNGIFEESEAVIIHDSAGTQLRNLWRYPFVSNLHRRTLVALRLNDEQRKEMSLALADQLIADYAPRFEEIAENLVELFTRAGERDKANTYRQYTQQPVSPLIARAAHHGLISLPWHEYDQWQQLVHAWLLLQEGKRTLLRIHYAESEAIFRQVVEIARRWNDRAYLAQGLRYQGWMMGDSGDPHGAMVLLKEALSLYQNLQDKGGEAATLHAFGVVYSALGDKQQALDYYNQALPLWRQVGDKGGEAATLNNIGSVYSALGEKQQALDYYNQALPLRRLVGDKGGEAAILRGMAEYFASLGELQKAVEYYEQALDLARKVSDPNGEVATLNNLGGLYTTLGEHEKAMEKFDQILPLLEKGEGSQSEAIMLHGIGVTYANSGQSEKASEFLERALELSQGKIEPQYERVMRINTATVYEKMDKLAQAEEQLLKVIAIDETIHHPDLEKDRAELAKLRAKKGGE